jgi:hypothetical protein
MKQSWNYENESPFISNKDEEEDIITCTQCGEKFWKWSELNGCFGRKSNFICEKCENENMEAEHEND